MEVRSLTILKKELETVSADLAKGHISILEGFIKNRLINLIKISEQHLAKDSGMTGTPAPTAAPTAATTKAAYCKSQRII